MKEELVTFYSTNDEMFDKADVGEVIDELGGEHEEIVGMEYYSHQFKLADLSKYLNVKNILEDADNYLYDNLGNEDGSFDVFTDVGQEAESALDNFLKCWIDEHLSDHKVYEPVGKSTTHFITKEDIASS